jgi:phage N-6-adenine-methyltransferase
MSALSSKSGEWRTPKWLVEKCRAALGGYITLDAAASDQNTVGEFCFTKARSALEHSWHAEVAGLDRPTVFLNPPGERSGKLIRQFWDRWNCASKRFHAACWVDFNLDHLRFITRVPADVLIIPRKRLAFVDPATGLERKGAQIGGFILFRGHWAIGGGPNGKPALFPERDYLVMRGEP